MQSCAPYLTSYIRFGATNDKTQVLKLQVFLDKFEGDSVPLSGTYDEATMQAVEAFQTKYAASVLTPWGITQPTGYVYLTTEQMINTIYCGGHTSFPLTTEQEGLITQSHTEMMSMGAAASSQTGEVKGAKTSSAAASDSDSGNTDMMGTSSDDLSASSSPVSSPFGGVGSFFHNLFSH